MHGALRPAGELLNIQPLPEETRKVEVRLRERVFSAGRLVRAPLFVGDILAASEGLASVVSRGLFRRNREVEFEYVEYYDSVDSWIELLGKPRVLEHRGNPQRIQEACDLMLTGEGGITVTQNTHAIRLERPGIAAR